MTMNQRPISLWLLLVCASLTAIVTPTTQASNAAFQDFFFAVCDSASGALAGRCNETDAGLGNVSGDSESSLNPSQSLGSGNSARNAFANRSVDARDLGYEVRAQEQGAGETVARGRFSLLLNGRTSTEEGDRRIDTDPERGYELDSQALQVGVDFRATDRLVLGGWVNWESTSLDFVNEQPGTNFAPTGAAGSVDQDTLGAAVFLATNFAGNAFFDTAIGFNRSDLDTTRNALFQESNRVVAPTAVRTRASTEGDELWATATLGISIQRNRWTVEPYAGLSLSRVQFDGYDERDLTNSGLALNVAAQDIDSTNGILGLRVASALSFAGGVLVPQLRVELNQEFDDDPTQSRVRFLEDSSNTTLTLSGQDNDDSQVLIGFGSTLVLPRGFSAFLEYQQTVGADNLDRWVLSGGLRLEL